MSKNNYNNMFKSEVVRLSETIKGYTNSKDKTSFVFLGYFNLWKCQSLLSSCGVPMNEMYKHLIRSDIEGENTNIYLEDIGSTLKEVDNYLEVWKQHLPNDVYERIESNWNVLGLKTLKEEFQQNGKYLQGLNKVVEGFNSIPNFDLVDLMDLFELLNISDRNLNDFFTPNSISKMVSQISLHNIKENLSQYKDKNEISYIDPTCGIGRLLYYTYVDLREEFPNTKINVCGIDIYEKFAVFSSSIMNLINQNDVCIVKGNSLTVRPPFPNFDFSVGNPPFGGLDKKSNVLVHKVNEFELRDNEHCKEVYKEFVSGLKKLKIEPINEVEYMEIVNDYKIV